MIKKLFLEIQLKYKEIIDFSGNKSEFAVLSSEILNQFFIDS